MDLRHQLSLDADVLVIGGGAAGVAAAVTTARQGLRVVLLEHYGFCGGGAVAGLSGTICGAYYAAQDSEAPPRQLVHGFLDEFLLALDSRGGLTPPIRYGKTFTRVHDPLVWREVADCILRGAGVRVVLHATVIGCLVEGGDKVDGVLAYTKEGTLTVRAKLTIDASGDADVVAMAGFPTRIGLQGRVQNPTMMFRLGGVDVTKFLDAYGSDSIMGQPITDLIRQLHHRERYRLPRSKIFLFPTPRPGELLCNCTRVVGADGRELNPLVAADLTEAEIEGRRQAREYARFIADRLIGCEASFVNDTGVQVGVRQTRQICGAATLTTKAVIGAEKPPTGVARSAWPIELHTGEKPHLQWLTEDYYEIPYECFVPSHGESILVAGRCLSAEHEAMASARVTAQCFSYGHAIGHAAALAVKDRIAPREIDGRAVRDLVNGDDARL